MYIVAIHEISDPAKFGEVTTSTPIPEGITLHHTFPKSDGSRAVCLWEADSVESVKDFVDPPLEGISRNDFFEVATANAFGLPG